MSEKEQLVMERNRLRLSNFAFVLGECMGHLSAILDDEDLQADFIDRGVTAVELKELKESIRKVAQVYYNPPGYNRKPK